MLCSVSDVTAQKELLRKINERNNLAMSCGYTPTSLFLGASEFALLEGYLQYTQIPKEDLQKSPTFQGMEVFKVDRVNYFNLLYKF